MSAGHDYGEALARAEQTFRVEAAEMLDRMEQCLLELDAGNRDGEVLHALFRSVHTIKGSAGLFGLHPVVSVAHRVETVLDDLRAGRRGVDAPLVSVLLRCGDHLRRLLEAREPGALDAVAADSEAVLAPLGAGASADASGPADPMPQATPAEAVWHVSLHFQPDCPLRGIDPLATVRYLSTLGTLERADVLLGRIPPLEALDPEKCHLAFELRLRTEVDEATLRDAFDFIEGDCDIRLVPPHASVHDYVRLIEATPHDRARLGEILIECGAVDALALHAALAQHHAAAAAGQAPPLGEVLVARGSTDRRVVDAAVQRQKAARERDADGRVIRVSAAKLDGLIDLVGELVIANATAHTHLAQGGMADVLAPLARLLDDVRSSALSLRMIPIGDTFARFHRVVRDTAFELGKDVQLEIHGGETELDKSLVEKIVDPLMHLVRNALDHGVETPAERMAAGKPRAARVTLSACHDAGSIVIRVEDDGRGIDVERVRAKAVQSGLIADSDALSDAEVRALIFRPGFSTAAAVTDISGRGVGMDVVRDHVEQLHGRVQVDSWPGHGTRFEIRLPLTLAIIDGFLVRCAGCMVVVPLDCIEECIAAPAEAHGTTTFLVARRGEVMPVIDVGRALGLDAVPAGARPSVLVCRVGGLRRGLLIDQLIGEYQTVIKPLGSVFQHLQVFAGSTILGSGEVALILDVDALVNRFAAAGQAIRAPEPACLA